MSNEISKLKKLQDALLKPKTMKETICSDYFYELFSGALVYAGSGNMDQILQIFNKFKASSKTSFEEYAILYQLSTIPEFVEYIGNVFENPDILLGFMLDDFLQNTVNNNIDEIIWNTKE